MLVLPLLPLDHVSVSRSDVIMRCSLPPPLPPLLLAPLMPGLNLPTLLKYTY
jgi:hypothetical protein